MKLDRLLKHFQEVIFPEFCILCDKEGRWVCESCLQELGHKGVFICPVCKRNTEKGVCCEDCEKKFDIDQHLAIFNYNKNGIKRLIRKFKYDYIEGVLDYLEPLIIDFLQNNRELFPQQCKVVPIPLHKKRLARRGFNQAELIGAVLSNFLEVEMDEVLSRDRNTKKQSELNRKERMKNVRGAFSLKEGLDSKNIILVDDVLTTGSTMAECAKILNRRTSVDKIIGFTLAEGK